MIGLVTVLVLAADRTTRLSNNKTVQSRLSNFSHTSKVILSDPLLANTTGTPFNHPHGPNVRGQGGDYVTVDKGTHCALSDLIPTISKYVAMEQKDMAAPQDMLMYERSWEGVFVMVDKGAHCTLHI
jgi:hypothetical protein